MKHEAGSKKSFACCLLHAGLLLGLLFNPEDGTFNRLHSIISQKTELCITTTVRTSNPTKYIQSFHHMVKNLLKQMPLDMFKEYRRLRNWQIV
jgi:hypothetical protein